MSRRSGRTSPGSARSDTLTKRQEEVVLEAFRTLHVSTAGSPDPEAITGQKMCRLEALGLAYAYELVDGLLQYRLTPKGIVVGRRLHLASRYGQDLSQETAGDRGRNDCPAARGSKVGPDGT